MEQLKAKRSNDLYVDFNCEIFTPTVLKKYWLRRNFRNSTEIMHCVKSVQMRSFFWSIFFRIRSEYGEIQSDHTVRSDGNVSSERKAIWLMWEYFICYLTDVNTFYMVLWECALCGRQQKIISIHSMVY